MTHESSDAAFFIFDNFGRFVDYLKNSNVLLDLFNKMKE
jgi:hypothetical protein